MSRTAINRLLATVLVIAGFGLCALAGVVIARAWPMLEHVMTRPAPVVAAQHRCRATAEELGFDVRATPENLRVTWAGGDFNNIRRAFAHASVLVSMCDSYQLHSFCAGRGCGSNKLFMTLRPVRKH